MAVGDARSGRSRVLVLVGDPGVGKSALLTEAIRLAAGFRVVEARGVESETELAFAGLFEVCRPLFDELDALAPQQRTALRVAFGIDAGPPATGFAIGAATLALLSASASDRPLLLVIDDAHWLDRGSADALAFAIRRLSADAVAVLVASRQEDGRPFVGRGLPELVIGGLDPASAERVLETSAARHPNSSDREAILALAAGNPLALIELHASEGPAVGGPEPIRLTDRLEQAFSARVRPLDAVCRRALLIAAAMGSDDLHALHAALEGAGLHLSALEAAESARLVSLDQGKLRFRHPLVRSAIYHAAEPVERRRAHALIAAAIGGAEAAWHLAAAAIGPDERAANALDAAADTARSRSGFAAAAAALERAARLSVLPADRVRRLAAGADAAWLAGRPDHASALIAEALRHANDPHMRGQLLHTRGTIEHFVGHAARAHRTLEEAAGLLVQSDPHYASLSLTEAVGSALFTGEVDRAVALGERAVAIARPEDDDQLLLASVPRGASLMLAGRPDEARPHLEQAARSARQAILMDDPRHLTWAALAGWWVGDAELMTSKAGAAVEWARDHSAPAAMPWASMLLGLGLINRGQWPEAHGILTEGADAGRLTAQPGHLAMVLSALAWLEAATGRREACQAALSEGLVIADRHRLRWIANWLLRAQVLLELGTGLEPDSRAVGRLRAAYVGESLRDPPTTSGWPDLIEALARLGHTDEAAGLLATFASEAEQLGFPFPMAVAARCEGLLADADVFESAFARALGLHATSGNPFETARTHLCYGERLRRTGRRLDARTQLSLALDTFERLEARPWAERARSELRATGRRLRRREESGVTLTEQEIQIALLVAEGRSNRDVGAALYLSPKTVEWHLGHIYGKLGITSRAHLASALRKPSSSARIS